LAESNPFYPERLHEYNTSRLGDRLRDVLRHGIFHVTSPNGYRGIVECGEIRPNSGHQFDYSYGQSAQSYAVWKRAVSLFDFESCEQVQVVEQWWKCEGFFTRFPPLTYVLKLRRDLMLAPLIRYEQATAEIGDQYTKIPYVEVWSSVPVPLRAVSAVIAIQKDPVRFRTLAPRDLRLSDAAVLRCSLWPGWSDSPTDEES
jgi:hypothetical protein